MYQCIENTKEGYSVQYQNKMYRVQDDNGWLLIYPTINGKRKKIAIKRILFEAGTIQDYVFNGWFELYEFETYLLFAKAEMTWLN